MNGNHHHVQITAGAYRPHHRPRRRQEEPQNLFFGLQPMVSPKPETSIRTSRIRLSKGPGTLVRLHPPRTVRAILPRRASDPIGRSFLARTLAILDCLIDCHRCRSPFPVLVRAPGAGSSGMAHGYNLRSVDASFLWVLPQKCNTFDTEGCRCSGHSPLNPQDVLRPLPTSR